jgi:hypothetical protein
MKTDANRSPEERLEPPHSPNTRRIVVPGQRVSRGAASQSSRITLGTAARTASDLSTQDPVEDSTRKRGYGLGNKGSVARVKEAKKISARTLIIVLAAVAAALVLMVTLFGSARDKGVILTSVEEKMLNEYRGYLAKNNRKEAEINSRLKDVKERIEAARWSRMVAGSNESEQEFRSLLLLDNDRQSPLYKYCAEQIKKK